jgi:hypothetical protein
MSTFPPFPWQRCCSILRDIKSANDAGDIQNLVRNRDISLGAEKASRIHGSSRAWASFVKAIMGPPYLNLKVESISYDEKSSFDLHAVALYFNSTVFRRKFLCS